MGQGFSIFMYRIEESFFYYLLDKMLFNVILNTDRGSKELRFNSFINE